MGRTLTNNTQLSYSIETSLGVAGSTWFQIEPNSIGQYGASITTVPRNPISKRRQRRKGTITDLDSSVEIEHDMTREMFLGFIEGFMFANFQTGPLIFVPTAVTSSGYTVPADGDLPILTLVYARGFTNAVNNGLKVLITGSTSTEIKASGLVTESSPPTDPPVSLEVCGIRGAAGDFKIDSSGDLITTALDMTTLGLSVGQFIWIGGSVAANQFFEQGDTSTNYGMTRLVAIATNKLTLEKKRATFVLDDGTDTGSGGTPLLIDIFFGRFIKNVAVDNAKYLERSYQFEAAYQDLATGPANAYEYSKGNFANTLQLNFPLTDKATMAIGFIGTDTEIPTTSRKTGADASTQPLQTAAYNTSSDFARLRVTEADETGLSTDVKSLTITINNNVTREKVLDNLGAKFMNSGNFEIDVEMQLLFSEILVVEAIRNNTTSTMEVAVRNDDGGFILDIPSMDIGGGGKEFPVNESVLINITTQAFEDPTQGDSLGITMFPFLPDVY